MAKKNPKNDERRAMVEKMRQDQARKEKQRSMLILGACIVVVLGLLSAAVIPYVNDKREDDRIDKLKLNEVGATKALAGCDEVTKKSAEGSGDHKAPGIKLEYPEAPPAFGPHWQTWPTGAAIRNFWTPDDRPPVEQIVHSLEHGHTLLWYDDTVEEGTEAYKDLQTIATKFSGDPNFNIAPWQSTDGAAFPDGKHVALTHWTGPDKQQGIWQYCEKPSGEVVADFNREYPKSNSPEPGAE